MFFLKISAFVASFCLAFNLAFAVQMPAIFSDGMVLQKSSETIVWGDGAPAERLTVAIGEAVAATVVDEKGKWKVLLNLTKVGPGPHILRIVGQNQVEIKDVLVGQVWLCSGQSNMEFKLGDTLGGSEEVAAFDHSWLRQYTVKKSAILEPSNSGSGNWRSASPTASAAFSGVAHYFGKALLAELNEPIGLIHASWGGTPVEAWTSSTALLANPTLKGEAERQREEFRRFPALLKIYTDELQKWSKKYQREDPGSKDIATFATEETSPDFGWKPVNLPSQMKDAGLADAGIVWLRRNIELSTPTEGRDMTLAADGFHQFDTVYWNGQKIGETTPNRYKGEGTSELNTVTRNYRIPGSLMKDGTNVLAIRLYSPIDRLGVSEGRFYLDAKTRIPLAGRWWAREEFSLPQLPTEANAEVPPRLVAAPRAWYVPGALFNGMIQPISPFTVKGVIWYQGEANVVRAEQYQNGFSALIENWRTEWNDDRLPFYFCQLANFRSKQKEPSESRWAELREAQTFTLQLPNTGQAVLIDVGEAGDIHPRDKKTVGNRLAAIALAKDYGRDLPYGGPCYQKMKIEGNKIRLSFTQAYGGLVAKPLPPTYWVKTQPSETRPNVRNSPNSELEGFSIQDADGRWFWADAVIEGDDILVSSPSVKNPVAVRYAWADNPTCNLYNKAGFPASPFRTDFPALKQR